MMALGVYTIKDNYKFANSFGRIGWAEDLLGPGRSFLVFKLVSIGMVFFGFLIAFGLFDNFLGILLNPIFRVLFKQDLI